MQSTILILLHNPLIKQTLIILGNLNFFKHLKISMVKMNELVTFKLRKGIQECRELSIIQIETCIRSVVNHIYNPHIEMQTLIYLKQRVEDFIITTIQ
jgi:hypothetical protein